jgi:hypothetical protein
MAANDISGHFPLSYLILSFLPVIS